MKISPATRRPILVGLVSGLLVVLLLWLGVLQRPEDFLYDLLLLARPAPPPGDVVIVGIDQKSLDVLGRFPWPRSTHARLVEQLHRMGARLIALDLIFSEPSSEDEELARAMERAGNVYLAVVRERRGEETVYLEPAAPLAGAAAGLGHTHLALSSDGVVRSIPVTVGPYPALSLLLAQAVRPVDRADIPVGPGQRMRINFARPDAIPVYSCVDVLDGRVPEDAVAGKIVLVGFMASGLTDQHAVPFTVQREPAHGVTVLAHALLTLLQGRFIRPIGLTHHPLFLILALAVWGWLLGRLSSYRRILALVALSVGVLLLSFLLLRMGFYAPPLAILTGGWLAFLGIAYGESREIERLVSAHLRRLPVLLSPDIREPATVPEEQLVSGVQALLEPAGVALIERTGRARYALKAKRGLSDAVPSRFRGTERDISSLDWWRRVGLGGWIQASRITSVQAVPVSGGPEDCPLPGRHLPPRWLVIFRSDESPMYPEDSALLDALIGMTRLPACAADGQGTLKGEIGRPQTLMGIQSRLTYQLAILSTTGESI